MCIHGALIDYLLTFLAPLSGQNDKLSSAIFLKFKVNHSQQPQVYFGVIDATLAC